MICKSNLDSTRENGYFSDRTFKTSIEDVLSFVSINDTSSPKEKHQLRKNNVFSFFDPDLEYPGIELLSGKGILLDRIQEAHKTIENLKTNINCYDTEIATLKQNNKKLVEQLNEQNNKFQTAFEKNKNQDMLYEKLTNINLEFSSVIKSQQNLIDKNQNLQSENEELNATLKETKNALTLAENAIIRLKIDANQLQEKYSKVVENENSIENKLKIITIEKENLLSEYQHIFKLSCQKEAEHSAVESNIQTLQNEHDTNLKEKHSLDIEHSKLTEQYNTLKKNSNKDIINLKQNIRALTSENTELLHKRKCLNVELDTHQNNLTNQIEENKKQAKCLSDYVSKLNFAQNIISQRESEKEDLNLRNEELTLELNKYVKIVDEIKKNKLILINKYKELQEVNIKLDNDKIIMKKQCVILSKKNKTISEEKLLLSQNFKECKAQIVELEKDLKISKNNNDSLIEERENLSQHFETETDAIVKEKNSSLENLKCEVNKLLANNSNLESKLKSKEEIISNIRTENDSKDSQLFYLNSQLRKLENLQNEQHKSFYAMQQQYSIDINSYNEKQLALQAENEKFSHQLIVKNKEIADNEEKWNLEKFEINCKNNDAMQEFKTQLCERDNLMKCFRKEKQTLLIKIKNMEKKIEKAPSLNVIEEMNNKITQQRELLQERINELNAEKLKHKENNKKLIEKNETLQKEIEKQNLQIETLRKDNAEISNQLNISKTNQSITHNSTVAELKNECLSYKAEITNLKKKSEELDQLLTEKEKEFTSHNQKTTLKFHEQNSKMNNLKSEYQKKVVQLQNVNKQLRQHQKKYNDLISEYDVIKELNKELEQRNNKILKDHEILLSKTNENNTDLKSLKSSYEDLLSKELTKQKTEFLYKENQLLRKLTESKQ